jgi:hypothetical protein
MGFTFNHINGKFLVLKNRIQFDLPLKSSWSGRVQMYTVVMQEGVE